MTKLEKTNFSEAYASSLADIEKLWTPIMQNEISKHNFAWRAENYDFINYFKASLTRYMKLIELLGGLGYANNLCDVGGFMGVFPLTLARLGLKVSMTESLKYYSSFFSPLFSMLERNGIEVIDYDPFEDPPTALINKYSAISLLAVLEHYPYSPHTIMQNLKKMMIEDARMVVEVPNIVFWPKRKAMLMGKSPLIPIEDKLASSVPFIGHHHEYSKNDLFAVIQDANLKRLAFTSYNYSISHAPFINRLLSEPTLTIADLFFPNARECLAVVAVKS